MIPHKTKRGAAALSRLRAFEGVPPPYDRKKRMVIPDALKVLRLQPGHKYCLLGRLSKEFGWHHYDTIAELEGKRKEKAQVSYERRKQLEKLRSKAVELAEKQLAPQMDKIKLDNMLVNFLDPLLVIQKEYEYTTINIKVTDP